MDNTVGWTLIVITLSVIGAKLVWLGYLWFFRRKELPKDTSGPVSGWGTPDD